MLTFTEGTNFKRGFFGFFLFMYRYVIQHCFIGLPHIQLCRRMLGSSPRLLRLRHWQPDALTTRLDLIYHSAKSHPHSAHPHSARSHPLTARSHPHSARSHPHSARSQPHSARSHAHSARSHPHSVRSHPRIRPVQTYPGSVASVLDIINDVVHHDGNLIVDVPHHVQGRSFLPPPCYSGLSYLLILFISVAEPDLDP